MKQNPYKCKYCGIKTSSVEMCENCKRKLPLVRELIKICEPLREAKRQRDIRKGK